LPMLETFVNFQMHDDSEFKKKDHDEKIRNCFIYY
jgi:hypothetical protein